MVRMGTTIILVVDEGGYVANLNLEKANGVLI